LKESEQNFSSLTPALVVSLLLHIALFLSGALSFDQSKDPLEPTIEVSLVKLPPQKPPTIIVPDSKSPEVKNQVARKLAGKSSLVPKESIRKGAEEGNAEKGKSIKPARVVQKVAKKPLPPRKPAPKPKVTEKPKKTPAKLKLDNPNLFAKLNFDKKLPKANQSRSKPERTKTTDKLREYKLQRALPFQKLSDPGGVTRLGSSAHLPNIPDGQITLLNAKADRHAVFVRRVALQVFGKLKQLGWTNLSSGEISRIRSFAMVEAVMSPEGKLLAASVKDSSGLKKFDGTMLEAGKDGTWDQNPPTSAKAADGNIHFIFKARSWSARVGETGREKRWLLMATGLL